MIDKINTEKILFLDIETVPGWGNFEQMPDQFKKLWEHKAKFLLGNSEQTAADIYQRAGIYAEFGKIICISVAFVKSGIMKVKSFYGDDEKKILEDFSLLLNHHYQKGDSQLCAHNGKEFDYPYIARRMLINGIDLPSILNLQGKKPWEVNLIDTMELWKFGDYKSYTSLELLCLIFDIPTSKDDISGADVADVYWKDKNLSRIVHYCQKDVIALVQLYRKFQNSPLVPDDSITII